MAVWNRKAQQYIWSVNENKSVQFSLCLVSWCVSGGARKHTVIHIQYSKSGIFWPHAWASCTELSGEAESYHCWSWVLDGHVLVISGIINTGCSAYSSREDTAKKYLVTASCVDVATFAGACSIPSRKETDHYRQIQCSVCCPPGSVNCGSVCGTWAQGALAAGSSVLRLGNIQVVPFVSSKASVPGMPTLFVEVLMFLEMNFQRTYQNASPPKHNSSRKEKSDRCHLIVLVVKTSFGYISHSESEGILPKVLPVCLGDSISDFWPV